MKKSFFLLLFLISLIFIGTFTPVGVIRAQETSGCRYSDSAFNTEIDMVFYGEQPVVDLAVNEIRTAFTNIEKSLSTSIKTSDIYKFNELASGESLVVDGITVEVLLQAKAVYQRTLGAFNPCSYLFSDLWQLSSRFSTSLDENMLYSYDRLGFTPPESKYIDAFKGLMDFNSIGIDATTSTISKTAPTVFVDGIGYEMKIDLGGIAKGFAGDKAKEILLSHNILDGYLSIGGSTMVLLNNPLSADGNWSVGILDPEKIVSSYAEIKIKNVSLSTSGDYQLGRFYIKDNTRYCHIIDTKIGAPIQTKVRTATVYGDISAAYADALTTAVMVLGADKGRAFINNSDIAKECSLFFVFEKNGLFSSAFEVITNTTKSEINITNSSYRIRGWTNIDGSQVYRPLRVWFWFWLVIAAIIVSAAIIISIVVIKKQRPFTTSQNLSHQKNVTNQKFFFKKDLIIYVSIFLVVVLLLVVFVFSPQAPQLKQINIYYENALVYTYSFDTNEGTIQAAGFEEKIEILKCIDKTLIKISTPHGFNTIVIEKDKAYVQEADCGGKDCISAFTEITAGNQAIVCSPHKLKILGVGADNNALLNG